MSRSEVFWLSGKYIRKMWWGYKKSNACDNVPQIEAQEQLGLSMRNFIAPEVENWSLKSNEWRIFWKFVAANLLCTEGFSDKKYRAMLDSFELAGTKVGTAYRNKVVVQYSKHLRQTSYMMSTQRSWLTQDSFVLKTMEGMTSHGKLRTPQLR